MPSLLAACRALSRSREAMALTIVSCPRCIAGMTCSRPILAVLRMPQRSLVCMAIMIDELRRNRAQLWCRALPRLLDHDFRLQSKSGVLEAGERIHVDFVLFIYIPYV